MTQICTYVALTVDEPRSLGYPERGMVQRGDGAGFTIETSLGLGIVGKMTGQNFDGNA